MVSFVERSFPLPDLPGLGDPPPAHPATPRAASTVMLVRPTDEAADGSTPARADHGRTGSGPAPGGVGGLEVFMLHRVPSMAFAPGHWVFPGGGVDPRDADVDLPWAGPDPEQWATWLGCDTSRARELVVAAAREVFEECGVLLAGPDAESVVSDVTGPEWDDVRVQLVDRSVGFAPLLRRWGLVLRTDLLRPHARWITPVGEKRRYDTAFFAARVPDGQRPDDRTSEAAAAHWVDPRRVLADHEAGRAALLPPTVVALERLADADDPDTFVADTPPYAAVEPRVLTGSDGVPRLVARIPT